MIEKSKAINLGELSHKNYLVLSFCMWYLLRNKKMPTNQEIDNACCMGGSPSQALKRLEETGYLLRTRKKRGIKFQDKSFMMLNEDEINDIWDNWNNIKNNPEKYREWIRNNKVSKKLIQKQNFNI